MKRKLDGDSPPPKKRKLDISHITQLEQAELADPSIIIPKLKVLSVSNGIVQIAFLNIDSFYEQEIRNENVYQFQLMYKCNHNEWKTIQYLNHEIQCYEYFCLKVLVDIRDYTLQFKLRSKLKNKWSSFCDTISIKIPSSLIAQQFNVGDDVEFRDKNEYYSREGRIIKSLPDNHVRIRPHPNLFAKFRNNINSDTELDYYFEHEHVQVDEQKHNHNHNHNQAEEEESDDDDDDIMNLLDANVDDDSDEQLYTAVDVVRRCLMKYKFKNRKRNDINVHCSRLYLDGIRLSGVIDICDNQINVDKMILLRSNDDKIINTYDVLNGIFCDYAEKYIGNEFMYFPIDKYQFKYIGRFMGKNVCDFLFADNDRFKWKIACLREVNDGRMCLNGVRKDIISARIDGLKAKVTGMNVYDIDNIVSFCDICRLEISEYDWRYNCDQHITNKHDICVTCAYNVINQYLQLNGLLYPLLKNELNDDCIQEITNFVVGNVVKL